MTVAALSVTAVEPIAEPKPKGYEFDAMFQRTITALVLRDTTFMQRTEGLIKPEYFHDDCQAAVVAVALDYYAKYKKSPHKSIIGMLFKEAIDDKRIRKDLAPNLVRTLNDFFTAPIADRDFAIDKCAEFAKQRAMETAVLNSAIALEKGDYAKIEAEIKKAMMVGASEGSGEYDYFAEIESRTETRVALAAGTIKPTGITTGYAEIDKLLYHNGWGRKELSCAMGRAKVGKSLSLADFGKNASLAGYNVLLASCEVSKEITADRLDANMADTMMKELKVSPFEVRKRIEAIAALPHGHLKIHDFATGSLKPSQLRRLLENYRHNGIIFDVIIVDYADIMCPEHFVNDTRENSRTIWVDLRAIAYEQNAAVLTATQTNRDGAKAMTAKATDVAEDYNKIRTADLVIGINATEMEIKSGEARLFFAASRNQAEMTIRIRQDRSRMKFLTKVLGVE